MLKISGHGEAFCETGTEGVLWSVYDTDPQKTGYDRLYVLTAGDRVTIYRKDDPRAVIWSGTVDYDFESNQQQSTYNPSYVGQAVFNHWVHGLQRGLDPEEWAGFFFEGFPMDFQRDCAWESFHRGESRNVFQKGELSELEAYSENRDDVAILSIKNELDPAEGKARYVYKQTQVTTVYLNCHDLVALRDTCDCFLVKYRDVPKGH